MKRLIGTARAGEPISAREWNKIGDAARGAEMAGPTAGSNNIDVGGVSGVSDGTISIRMVRIIHPVIADASTQVADNNAANPDPQKYNAWFQVWDTNAQAWADEPGGDKCDVSLVDDAAGWLPLLKEARLPVFWNNAAGKWLPIERTEASVVMITSNVADSDGFKPGVRFAFNSDTKAWIVVEEILVIDVGA